jgi:hypothetical protein
MSDWNRINEIVRVGSPWVTLIGERWRCDKGKELEYWRVEKVDSVIVLPVQADHVLCAAPTFRPGVGYATLDFPGGRLPPAKAPRDIVPSLLERELGIPPEAVDHIEALNAHKWNINSSFSNQGLWAFVAEIDPSFAVPDGLIGARAKSDLPGLAELRARLDCLQCRAVLLEWQQRGR